MASSGISPFFLPPFCLIMHISHIFLRVKTLFSSGQIILKIIAVLLKNAIVLLKRLEIFLLFWYMKPMVLVLVSCLCRVGNI